MIIRTEEAFPSNITVTRNTKGSSWEMVVEGCSPSLIMSREKTMSSSFLAPSGAYLTWMEMLKDEEEIISSPKKISRWELMEIDSA